MRHYSVALLGVLAFAAGVFAQQAPPESVGTPEQLNDRLTNWEREMAAVKSLSAECKRIDVNRVINNRVELSGYIKCLKVDGGSGKVDKLASLELREKDKPEPVEKYICTGELLYRFSPRERILYVHKLPGQMSDENILALFFQLKAEAMKKRYDLTLVKPDDPNYVYLDIKPLREADKVEFQRARLVLFKRNYLPAQLWFEEPNGNHHTWELSKVLANDPAVKAVDFIAPEKPKGWEIKEVKAETENPPRVVRPAPPPPNR
jgi:TIGR03009 family protein